MKIKNDLMSEFKLFRDHYDPWGSAMELYFAVASELWVRGESIPDNWHYSPGMASDPREPESSYFDLACETSDQELLDIGNLLHRYTQRLDRAGCSY